MFSVKREAELKIKIIFNGLDKCWFYEQFNSSGQKGNKGNR